MMKIGLSILRLITVSVFIPVGESSASSFVQEVPDNAVVDEDGARWVDENGSPMVAP